MKKTIHNINNNLVVSLFWIGLIISLIGLIGIIIINIALGGRYYNIALGVMIAGFLLIFLGTILNRLRKMGIDYFVTGAIIAYLGYILVAIPAIFYSFNFQIFDKDFWNFVLIGSGIVLIILGFFTETYELNKKLIKLFKLLGQQIKNLIAKINWSLVFAPINLLTVAGIILIIIAALKAIPPLFNVYFYYYIIGGSLIAINIIFHLRSELFAILKYSFNIILTILRGIIKGISKLPKAIVSLSKWLYKTLIKALKYIWKAFRYLVINNYLILFAIGIASFFVMKTLMYEVRLSISIIVCVIAIVKPLVDKKAPMEERISSTKMFIYQKARWPKKILSRKTTCPYCGTKISIHANNCPNCGKKVEKCYICSLPISKDSKATQCPNCGNFFHYNHFITWLKLKGHCPICKSEIKSISKLKKFKFEANNISKKLF